MYIFYLAMIKFTNVLILTVSIAFNKFVKAPAITRAKVLYSNNNQKNPNNLRCNPALLDYDYYACYNINPDIIYPQTQQQINQDHATTQVAEIQEPEVHEDKSYGWTLSGTHQTGEPTVERTPNIWEYADYVTGNGETAHEEASYYIYDITDEGYVSDGVENDNVYDSVALFEITNNANAENQANQDYEHTGDREATEVSTDLKLQNNNEYDEALPRQDAVTTLLPNTTTTKPMSDREVTEVNTDLKLQNNNEYEEALPRQAAVKTLSPNATTTKPMSDREVTEVNTDLKLQNNNEYDEALPRQDAVTTLSPNTTTTKPMNTSSVKTTISRTTYTPSTVIIWEFGKSPITQRKPPDVRNCNENSRCRYPFGYPNETITSE